MAIVGSKWLIFRLGGIGFFLDLVHVIEVVGQISAILDPGSCDVSRWGASALRFRHTWIPVVDPAPGLELISTVEVKGKTAIVLHGVEGDWAILVDQVAELSSGEVLKSCDIPFLLKSSAKGCYSQIMLLDKEPYVAFDPEYYYGLLAVAR